jgi:hypothetical protein
VIYVCPAAALLRMFRIWTCMPGQAAWAVTETAATASSRLKTPATRVGCIAVLLAY